MRVKKRNIWIAGILLVFALVVLVSADITPIDHWDFRGFFNLTSASHIGSSFYCNGTNGNCHDITDFLASGAGDITAVNTDGIYLFGGATTGDADLFLNETQLNATIVSLGGSAGNLSFNQTLTDELYLFTNGSGISLVGLEFNHSDTSSQSDSDNSGNVFIQDILLDTFGHLTSIVTSTVVGQNLWATFTSDSGSTTANALTDTLTVSGAGTVSTGISGDTLTITGSAHTIDTQKNTGGQPLYNDSATIFFNQTQNNESISLIHGIDDAHLHSLLNITGTDANTCGGSDKVTDVDFADGVLSTTCGTDLTSASAITTTEGIYGELQNFTSTGAGVGITAQDTWTQVTIFQTGESNGMTLDTANQWIQATEAGVYTIDWAMSFSNGGNTEFEIAPFLNNATIISQCQQHRKLGAGGDVGSASGHCLYNFAAGENLSLQMLNQDGSTDATSFNVNLRMVRNLLGDNSSWNQGVADLLYADISVVDTDTQKNTNGEIYLFNDSTTIKFNETQLNITIDNRDADTTYTNGSGLSLVGTEFNHSDTSSQADSDNSGNTFIQDIVLDGFGHLTGLTTAVVTGQDLWFTFISDSGSTSANTLTDTLTVSGAGTVSTGISGDTLTITGTAHTSDTWSLNLTSGVSADLTPQTNNAESLGNITKFWNTLYVNVINVLTVLTDAQVSDTLTIGSGSTVDKGALANSGALGFDWVDGEVADTLTIDSSSTVADGALSSNVPLLDANNIFTADQEIRAGLNITNSNNLTIGLTKTWWNGTCLNTEVSGTLVQSIGCV